MAYILQTTVVYLFAIFKFFVVMLTESLSLNMWLFSVVVVCVLNDKDPAAHIKYIIFMSSLYSAETSVVWFPRFLIVKLILNQSKRQQLSHCDTRCLCLVIVTEMNIYSKCKTKPHSVDQLS